MISRCSQCFFWNLQGNRLGKQDNLYLTVLSVLLRKQTFLSTYFFNCNTINTFSFGSLCLEVFFSCSVGLHPVNTYVVIILSWFLFFVFLISISSHFMEYMLKNKNSSKLHLDSDILIFLPHILFFSSLVCNTSNRLQGILKKAKSIYTQLQNHILGISHPFIYPPQNFRFPKVNFHSELRVLENLFRFSCRMEGWVLWSSRMHFQIHSRGPTLLMIWGGTLAPPLIWSTS